jgi:hypothetical protein
MTDLRPAWHVYRIGGDPARPYDETICAAVQMNLLSCRFTENQIGVASEKAAAFVSHVLSSAGFGLV